MTITADSCVRRTNTCRSYPIRLDGARRQPAPVFVRSRGDSANVAARAAPRRAVRINFAEMEPAMSARFYARFAIVTCLVAFAPVFALGASGTWTQSTAGTYSWENTSNWSSATVADGATFTADFSTLDITGDMTVNLDGASGHTIGSLLFADTGTGSAGGWTIGGPKTLTLDNGANPAVITVGALAAGKTVTINAPLTSTTTAGFRLDGSGTLVLNNAADNLTGPIIINSTGALTFATGPSAAVGAIQFGT